MGIMEKEMETTIMGYLGYRIWGIWGSSKNIPKAIFYLLKGTIYWDYIIRGSRGGSQEYITELSVGLHWDYPALFEVLQKGNCRIMWGSRLHLQTLPLWLAELPQKLGETVGFGVYFFCERVACSQELEQYLGAGPTHEKMHRRNMLAPRLHYSQAPPHNIETTPCLLTLSPSLRKHP